MNGLRQKTNNRNWYPSQNVNLKQVEQRQFKTVIFENQFIQSENTFT